MDVFIEMEIAKIAKVGNKKVSPGLRRQTLSVVSSFLQKLSVTNSPGIADHGLLR